MRIPSFALTRDLILEPLKAPSGLLFLLVPLPLEGAFFFGFLRVTATTWVALHQHLARALPLIWSRTLLYRLAVHRRYILDACTFVHCLLAVD